MKNALPFALLAVMVSLALSVQARPDVLCIYYPEWHVYPEGEEIFGKGRSEWDLVNTAKPFFPGHDQPVQLLDGCPDDSDPAAVAKEIDYAAGSGIDVFVYDWYWADGHPIQHEALERGFMKAPNRSRMKFALMWANHDRSNAFRPARGHSADKYWWKLKWTSEEFLEAIDYCIRTYFASPEYYRKDGKVFFSVYSAMRLIDRVGGPEKMKATLQAAQAKMMAAGLPPLHFSAMVHNVKDLPKAKVAGYDSASSYNVTPYDFDDNDVGREVGRGRKQVLTHVEFAQRHRQYNTRIAKASELPYIPTATRGWDCTPRCRQDEPFPWASLSYPYLGVVSGLKPEIFRGILEDVRRQAENDPLKPGAILINAWNEYTEGCYLMPDKTSGRKYLDAVKTVFGTGTNTSAECQKRNIDAKAEEGRLSVRDFGAKGDGVTDDTAAIQAGLDYLAARGGGKLYFPYTTNGYLIASPAKEYAANGRLVRAQLVIPPGFGHNIRLEGEMPCKLLYSYQVRPKGCEANGFRPTVFGSNRNINTMLHSTWDAPEVTDPKERPWAVIAAPEGDSCAGKFSVSILSFANLEIRVHLDRDKMYPTTSAANFHNVSRLIVEDSQFCLDENVGDTNLGKELQESPCHTVGLMASGDQNDDQIFRNVASQGFKYGFVFGEHTCAEHLYVHNTEYAISFADATHPAIINRVVAQHNARILCTLPNGTFGRRASWVNIIVNECDYETGFGTLPAISRMQYGVFDPDSRFRGNITHLQGYPGNGKCHFPVLGGTNLVIRALGEKF